RVPDLFTGFDSNDNIPLVQLRPGFFAERDVPALAALVREHLKPRLSQKFSGRRTGRGGVAFVMDLLCDEGLEQLLSIKDSPAGVSLDQEALRVLLQRWNAVLVHPE